MPSTGIVGQAERHVPALDGIRGAAILLVILFHCRSVFNSPAELPYVLLRVMDLGWSGVDLFFVLSGFLITGVLLDSRESPTYFRTFYLRRALRIFPLYFAYLFLVLVVFRFGWLWAAGADLWKATNPWWYVTYLLNWKSDHGYNDLYLGHFWSLAIEEQFYCVWPLVVWLCPVKRLRWLCLGIAIASLASRYQLGRWGLDQEAIYRMTPSRTEALVWGAMAAVGLRQFPKLLWRWSGPVFFVAATVLLNVVLRAQQGMWHDWQMRTAGVSSLAAAYACLVLWAAAPGTGIVSRIFSIPLLRRLGRVSYAMYVFQSIPYHLTLNWVRDLSASSLPWLVVVAVKYLYFPVSVAVVYGAAWLSWRVLEEPILRLKSRFNYSGHVDGRSGRDNSRRAQIENPTVAIATAQVAAGHATSG
jgi:peptidoglycan/LPS O-acetylase OafA/YrhL